MNDGRQGAAQETLHRLHGKRSAPHPNTCYLGGTS